MNVFMADLRASQLSSPEMPLGIASLAAYLINNVKDVDVKLFTDPHELLKSLKKGSPDVFMVSNYCWNSNLATYMTRYIKHINNNCLCLMGGPNFSLDFKKRQNFVINIPELDYYIRFDGEIPSLQLLQAFIHFDCNRYKLKNNCEQLPSACYVYNGHYYENDLGPRLKSLDDLPSPYSLSLMDQLFEFNFTPHIQSIRGCPHSCSYCNMGIRYYSKLIKMSPDRFKSDLNIIVDKMIQHNHLSGNIHLSDDNFGYLKEDEDKAKYLKEINERTGYPRRVIMYTPKIFTKNAYNTAKHLKHLIYASNTPQSLNIPTLRAIKRPLKSIERFEATSNYLIANGFKTQSELISHLPLETFDSFLSGLNILDKLHFSDYTAYQLTIIDGSPLETQEQLNKFDIKYKYRPHPSSKVIIGMDTVQEFEKVVISTSTMSEADYYKIRLITFLLRLNLAFGHKLLFTYSSKHGLTSPELSLHIANSILNNEMPNNSAAEMLRSFCKDSYQEIFDEPDHVPASFMSHNLVHKYRALILTNSFSDLLNLYIDIIKSTGSFQSNYDLVLLDVIAKIILKTDLRVIFVNQKVNFLNEINSYITETYDYEYVEDLIEGKKRLETGSIPTCQYCISNNKIGILRAFFAVLSKGPMFLTRAYNDITSDLFQLKKA